MEIRRRVHISIELDGEGEPIAGRIRSAGADWRPFYGWINLAAALEDARHPDPLDVKSDEREARA